MSRKPCFPNLQADFFREVEAKARWFSSFGHKEYSWLGPGLFRNSCSWKLWVRLVPLCASLSPGYSCPQIIKAVEDWRLDSKGIWSENKQKLVEIFAPSLSRGQLLFDLFYTNPCVLLKNCMSSSLVFAQRYFLLHKRFSGMDFWWVVFVIYDGRY